MHSIIIALPARADITHNYEYLSEFNSEVALKFFDATRYSFAEIARNPQIGRNYPSNNPRLNGLRKWYVKGFRKYLIFYRVQESAIEIVRVLQGVQDIERILNDEL
ncbi:MAG: type II toxin-antitoxin system RelE/ParE family toxin [Pseudanabaenaceae cyanobacterium bins.39]|nr:type II toxin-antitoxin system RelE/ParE family toxin [Pseudanabaenaceae cyanobacterium bins.39]